MQRCGLICKAAKEKDIGNDDRKDDIKKAWREYKMHNELHMLATAKKLRRGASFTEAKKSLDGELAQ